jgi:O-antigen/teichoic acid export membrane protein
MFKSFFGATRKIRNSTYFLSFILLNLFIKLNNVINRYSFKISLDSIKLILRDSIKYIISKVIPGLVGLLSVPIFIKFIGYEQYGKYSLIFSFVVMVSSFFIGWINQSILRYYTKYAHVKTAEIAIILAFILSIIIGIIIILLAIIIAFPHLYSLLSVILILSLFVAFSYYNLRMTLFQAQIKPNYVILSNIIQSSLSLILPIIFFHTIERSYLVIIFGLLLSYSLPIVRRFRWSFMNFDYFCHHKIPDISIKSIFIEFLHYGYPLSFWYLFTSMLPVIDRYLIQHYYSFSEAGAYAGIYDLIMRSYTLTLFPITMAVHPQIMNFWNLKKYQKALSILKLTMIIQFVIFGILIIAFLFLSNFIVEILSKYASYFSTSLILLLLIGGFLWQFALLAHKPLELSGKTLWMLLTAMIVVIISFIGNYFFLPIYGVIASAYMTIVSSAIYLFCCFLLSRRVKYHLQG